MDWPDNLEAIVVKPMGSDTTCHQGKGRLLDYLVCSACLVPYVDAFEVQSQVLWGPHDGLELVLCCRLTRIMVSQPRRPRPLRLPALNAPLDPAAAAQHWGQAKAAQQQVAPQQGSLFPVVQHDSL